MKILIDNGHGIDTKGKRSPDGRLLEYAQNRLLAGCIVLHTLTTESPLDSFEGIPVPQMEKMLVDIVLNPEFDFLQGSELSRIYREAFTAYDISRPRLLRYAQRRGCLDKIQQLIDRTKSTNHD